MKNKKLLAIILLSLSFCFVSGVGYGLESEEAITHEEIITILRELKANGLQLFF